MNLMNNTIAAGAINRWTKSFFNSIGPQSEDIVLCQLD